MFVHTKGAIYNSLTSWIKKNIAVLSLLVKKETPIVLLVSVHIYVPFLNKCYNSPRASLPTAGSKTDSTDRRRRHI